MRFNIDLENVKYLKILYKDNNGCPCVVKSAIKKFDDKEILACLKYEKDLNLSCPQDITLSIVCSDGLYRTNTTLKSVEYEKPYVFILLLPPQGLEYQQNREYFRVNADYSCIYSIKLCGEIKQYKVKTHDISANGVSLMLPEHILSDEDTYLDISVEGVEIRTKIKYVRGEKIDSGYLLSFTYTQITDQDRDFISRACIQKQLEQKRNSAS